MCPLRTPLIIGTFSLKKIDVDIVKGQLEYFSTKTL